MRTKSKKQAQRYSKRANADHRDSKHPIEVSRHFRKGPKGYQTLRQRAIAGGQTDLFSDTDYFSRAKNPRKAKRKNPAAPSRIADLHETFLGRAVDDYQLVELPDYYPDDLVLLGEASEIGYIAAKDHIGNGKTFNYVHEFGEESGKRPMLAADAEGNLHIIGGNYVLEDRGIVD